MMQEYDFRAVEQDGYFDENHAGEELRSGSPVLSLFGGIMASHFVATKETT
jgi:hypothetical protein